MTTQNTIDIQQMELRQKQFIMMGGKSNTNQKKLSELEIKQIKQKYRSMYIGFVSINWGSGKTLGVSWQKALEQMDGFIASKSKIVGHPINNELVKYHAEFRRDMARHIMTSDYSEDKLSEEHKKFFFDDGEKMLKKSKSALDSLYQQYMPQQNIEKTSIAHKFGLANQKVQQMLQQLLMQQQMNGRAA